METERTPLPPDDEADEPTEEVRPLALFFAELLPEEGKRFDAETDRILERRERVAQARARRKTVRQIAKEVGCSPGTIQSDLNVLRAGHLRSAAQSTKEHVAQALQDLEERLKTIWEAWDRSCGERTETTTDKRDGKTPSLGAKVKRTQGIGDPRLLQQLRLCWVDFCALTGIVRRADLIEMSEEIASMRAMLRSLDAESHPRGTPEATGQPSAGT